jgi:hypothetical protein
MVKIISGPSPEAVRAAQAWKQAQAKAKARKAGFEAKKLAEKLSAAAAARVNPAPTSERGLRRAARRAAQAQ